MKLSSFLLISLSLISTSQSFLFSFSSGSSLSSQQLPRNNHVRVLNQETSSRKKKRTVPFGKRLNVVVEMPEINQTYTVQSGDNIKISKNLTITNETESSTASDLKVVKNEAVKVGMMSNQETSSDTKQLVEMWGQCGGKGYTGPTTCSS
jgi:hypothetical protein